MAMIIMTENLATKITVSNTMWKTGVNYVEINKWLLNEQYDEEQYAIG